MRLCPVNTTFVRQRDRNLPGHARLLQREALRQHKMSLESYSSWLLHVRHFITSQAARSNWRQGTSSVLELPVRNGAWRKIPVGLRLLIPGRSLLILGRKRLRRRRTWSLVVITWARRAELPNSSQSSNFCCLSSSLPDGPVGSLPGLPFRSHFLNNSRLLVFSRFFQPMLTSPRPTLWSIVVEILVPEPSSLVVPKVETRSKHVRIDLRLRGLCGSRFTTWVIRDSNRRQRSANRCQPEPANHAVALRQTQWRRRRYFPRQTNPSYSQTPPSRSLRSPRYPHS